mmetsp:Transcript_4224/g.15922  ORF Transcript_4224/g.15922 Transcript_4224/m.15922 type:complete len:960 (-) Transcript_4224:93-2972(-)
MFSPRPAHRVLCATRHSILTYLPVKLGMTKGNRIVFTPNFFSSTQHKEPTFKAYTTSQASDFAFCFKQMSTVSRSFHFVTLELPEKLRREVCVFYLLLRALDTIEDTPQFEKSKKIHWLTSFHQNPSQIAQSVPMDDPLLKNMDRIVAALVSLGAEERSTIELVTRDMGTGMAKFQEQEVKTTEDCEEYCGYVAGLVGEGLTKLFYLSGLQSKKLNGSVPMGLFLQMVNVIRDIHADRQEGRTFWPANLWTRYANTIDELNSVRALNEMIKISLQYAPQSLAYLRDIEDESVFNFCAIPQVMAMATLARLYEEGAVFERSIKISKVETVQITAAIQLKGIRAVEEAFVTYAQQIESKMTEDNPQLKEKLQKIYEAAGPAAVESSAQKNSDDRDSNSCLTPHQGDPTKPQKVVVVGSGPGGLGSAMLLRSKGYDVHVFERFGIVGGRNSNHVVGKSHFDLGPTMLMMRFVVDQIFHDAGRVATDYLNFVRVEPMYRLYFSEQKKKVDFYSEAEAEKMHKELERAFPDEIDGYHKYMHQIEKVYHATMPMMQKVFHKYTDMICTEGVRALPFMRFPKSVWQTLDIFKSDLMKLSFSFQTVYLGMQPKSCPAFFNIIPFVEHKFGVWHIKKGLNALNTAMAKVYRDEMGGNLSLNAPVKQFIMDGSRVKGVELQSGELVYADYVVLNADFSNAMTTLVPNAEQVLKKWKPSKLPSYHFSSSTFMLYLDLDKVYENVPVHNLVFSGDYDSNFEDIDNGILPKHLSFYFRNSTIIDPEVNPEGGSGLYFLLPVPNQLMNRSIDWDSPEIRDKLRSHLITEAEKQCGLTDLHKSIRAERIITPKDWEQEHQIYGGATYNLAHNLLQLLAFRPRSKFEELEGLYISSGAGSPGSGIPVILENARMCADTIIQETEKSAQGSVSNAWKPKPYVRVPLNSQTFTEDEQTNIIKEIMEQTTQTTRQEQV